MKDSLSNPVRYGKIITLEAIMLTAAINLLFFILFSVPDVRSEKDEREAASVTLLRFSEDDRNSLSMRQYIADYAPTHFSSSRSPQGFGSYVDYTVHVTPKNTDLGNRDTILHPSEEKIPVPLPSAISPNRILPPRAVQFIEPGRAAQTVYPFAVSTSGMVIPINLSTDEQLMANEFPLNCGVYKLFLDRKNHIMPRLVLLQSCGRRAFDHLSMKQLYQEIRKLANCPDGEIFTVHYREHDDTRGDI